MGTIYLGAGALIAIAIFIIFLGIDRVIHSAGTTEERMDIYARRAGSGDDEKNGKAKRGLRGRDFSGLPFTQQIAAELAQADLKLTPLEFLIINGGTTIAGYALALLIFRGDLLVSIVGAAVGAYAPRVYVRFKKGQRLSQFSNQLGDTLLLLSNSLRTGYSLQQSIDTASRELPSPISVEFGRVTREVGLGLAVSEALGNMVRRIPSEDLDLIVTAINVNHEVGGNLAEILDTIAFTIRERIRIQGDIRALTAMQRMSGNILALLPVVLGFVLYAMNPNYISGFWKGDNPACGISMLVVGGIMVVIGYFVVRRIATIEV